jgi:pantetheine-phosphate adenylyltransferase
LKAVYAGSFDPITVGHLDLIERASKLCDELVVAVGNNPRKKYTFIPRDRKKYVEMSVGHLQNVRVVHFEGLLVTFLKSLQINTIIRGIRAFSDFESELQIASANRYLDPNIETIFMMPKEQYSCISSSMVRELLQLKVPPDNLVPGPVLTHMYAYIASL